MFKSFKLLFAFVQALLRSMLNLSSALEKATDELANLTEDWQDVNAIHRNANLTKARAKANKRLQKALSSISTDSVSKQAKETQASSNAGEVTTLADVDKLVNQ